MIKFYSYSCPVPLRFLCSSQKQVSESRDMQSAETQLVNEVSCMARKAGYLAKVLSDKGLCETLIADPCNLQSQYRSKLVCYLRDQLTSAPLARNSLHISNLSILLAPHLRQGDSVSASGVGTYALHINETLLIWSPRVIKYSKNNFAYPIKVAIFAKKN